MEREELGLAPPDFEDFHLGLPARFANSLSSDSREFAATNSLSSEPRGFEATAAGG